MWNVLRVGTDFNERRVGLSVSESSNGLSSPLYILAFDILVDRFDMKRHSFCFIHIYIYIYVHKYIYIYIYIYKPDVHVCR